MCALACIMVFGHSSGSMMLGADWLSWLDSATDSRLWEGGEAATILLVLCLCVGGTGWQEVLVLSKPGVGAASP